MTDIRNNAVNYPALANPQIQLHGVVDDRMYDSFKSQLASASADGPLVVSITTLGGDPEMARAMGDEHPPAPRLYRARDAVPGQGRGLLGRRDVHVGLPGRQALPDPRHAG